MSPRAEMSTAWAAAQGALQRSGTARRRARTAGRTEDAVGIGRRAAAAIGSGAVAAIGTAAGAVIGTVAGAAIGTVAAAAIGTVAVAVIGTAAGVAAHERRSEASARRKLRRPSWRSRLWGTPPASSARSASSCWA